PPSTAREPCPLRIPVHTSPATPSATPLKTLNDTCDEDLHKIVHVAILAGEVFWAVKRLSS
ncbi:hypothetical protein, partial [Streptomyces sp. NPDC048489]|uniref:hypothetical protein n=1 Tax=Streptomyces sp. NPDC048489 TaxID=3154504 RepID=UPI00343B4782